MAKHTKKRETGTRKGEGEEEGGGRREVRKSARAMLGGEARLGGG
jgi:hypothetical protein